MDDTNLNPPFEKKGKKGKKDNSSPDKEKKKSKATPVRLNDEDVSIIREQVLRLEKMILALPKCAKTTSLLINVQHMKKKLSSKGESILRKMVSEE